MTAAVLPIGHYVGAFHPATGAEPAAHLVRVGWNDHELAPAGLRVWALAHGLPDRLARGEPWTRRALLGATGGDPAVSDAAVDELLGAGLLVEVDPAGDTAVSFAREHRLAPLMLGLGNTAEQPGRWRLGYGATAVAAVPLATYHLWKYGHLAGSLWAACSVLADLGAAEEADPSALLAAYLPALHGLLAAGAAYLDVVDGSP